MTPDVHGAPTTGDAFGAMLHDCWAGGGAGSGVRELLERDDGQLYHSDAGLYFTAAASWPDVDQELLRRVRGTVLDIGCGGGRTMAELQARGHEVLGVDPSPGAVRLCTGRGLRAVEATAADLGAVDGEFDTLVLTGNGLGFLESREQAPRVLKELARVARPGAALLGTTFDPARLTAPTETDYRARNVAAGRLPGQWRIRVRYAGLATDWFRYAFLSPDDLAELTAGSPWRIEEIHSGDFHYLAHLVLD
ncbi:class I SAM-dependent methyltransferase [Streptomyces sp. x-80]|jgi:SAM-dependent methyltransferase|uniref:class I SAM-dependent methyltransferase n=1 Tax=Streptomyces sp. x-80 TaxID=2789282 RepID=UPI00397F3EEA